MKRVPRVLWVATVLGLMACGQKPGPTPTPSESTLNADTTLTESSSDTPTGLANVEDPQTGTNTGRPDSPKDLKPGTDGNANPPTQ